MGDPVRWVGALSVGPTGFPGKPQHNRCPCVGHHTRTLIIKTRATTPWTLVYQAVLLSTLLVGTHLLLTGTPGRGMNSLLALLYRGESLDRETVAQPGSPTLALNLRPVLLLVKDEAR